MFDEKTKRIAFYNRRQQIAEKACRTAWQTAMQNEEFKDLYSQAKRLSYFLVREDLDEKTKQCFREYNERLIARMKAVLKTMGLSFEDLEVKRFCKKCNDTGYILENGKRCDCYTG